MTFQITINQDKESEKQAIYGSIFEVDEASGEAVATFAMPEFPLKGMSAIERKGAWDSYVRTAVNELYWRIADTLKKPKVAALGEQIKNIWKGDVEKP